MDGYYGNAAVIHKTPDNHLLLIHYMSAAMPKLEWYSGCFFDFKGHSATAIQLTKLNKLI
jgi:hypothetical protein